ncbi:cytochrome c [Neisseria weixii]|uniref:Cytochrome c n=1 Tax=Neisseria weixii TaxID=1853276 RepID=A0A3N4NAF0_9NEIS|nr:cytochrome c [Neisseria weixii]RPD89020.1 cytochrome c [Neisseria weixii]RPD89337.1 cytochrome c [Neisseria weixii]
MNTIMKCRTIAALLTSVFVLAACSGSEPAAEKLAETSPVAEIPASAEADPAGQSAAEAPASVGVPAPAAEPALAAEAEPAPATAAELSQDEQIKLGKAVYDSNCMACHGAEGKGVEGTFPPLEKSDYFAKDNTKLVHAVTKGVNGAIKVNGKDYNGVMPAVPLSDQDIANVVTYVLNSFGNNGGQVSAAEVAEIKNK